MADGLAVGKVGDLAFATAAPRVDRVVTVSEEELSLAMLRLVELEKSVVEGAGAAPLAAVMFGKLPELAGLRTVLDPLGWQRRSADPHPRDRKGAGGRWPLVPLHGRGERSARRAGAARRS